jgi:hypothetical protein
VEKLRAGCDLVIGCRFPAGGGTIRPGAMPWKNRWLGNPLLSFLGQLLFKTRVRDFHCGLRAVTRSAYDRLDLQTTGMEFASEMVIKAALKKMVIAEVPVVLHRDGRLRPPHLRPWRDGWRHLRFMLLFSPLWLFLVPGLFFVSFGGVMGAFLTAGSLPLGPIRLDINSLVICAMSLMLGFELCLFAVFTRAFAILAGFLPESERIHFFHRHFSLEKGLGAGLTLMGLGLGLIFFMIWQWGADHFGALPQPENLRRIIPAALLFTLGLQVIFSSFFLSILSVQRLSGPRSATP